MFAYYSKSVSLGKFLNTEEPDPICCEGMLGLPPALGRRTISSRARCGRPLSLIHRLGHVLVVLCDINVSVLVLTNKLA